MRLDLALTRPLWLDEIFTGAVTQGSIADIFRVWLAADVHPPLHYLLLDAWTALFGRSDFALRAPSLLASLGTIALGARAMARRHGTDAGWIAAITLAVPAGAIFYAAEARSYALQMLFALALMLAHGALRRDWRAGQWAVLVGLTALLCLTHYFGFLFAACIWAVLLADAWAAQRLRAWLVAGAATAMLLAPWLVWHLPYMLGKTGGNFWIPPLGFSGSMAALTLSVWSDGVFAASFGLAAAAIALWHRLRAAPAPTEDDLPWRAYLVVLGGALLVLALISLSSPLVVPRYVLLFLPMTSLMAARALLLLRADLARLFAVAMGAAVLGLGQFAPIYGAPGRLAWGDASDWLAQRQPDQILFAFDDGAGVHIGAPNAARVGGFFLRRAGYDVLVTARIATNAQPILPSDLPPGRRIGVLLVAGQVVGTDSQGRWINRDWLDSLRRAYPRHHCHDAPALGPRACIFETKPTAGTAP